MFTLGGPLILFVALTLSGVGYQVTIMRSEAVIFYPDGHTEQVRVVNHGDFFCPLGCPVQHRHRVHDVRWDCSSGDNCHHYSVFHVRIRRGENRITSLQRELQETELSIVSDAELNTQP